MSAGLRLPNTPEPSRFWPGFEGLQIAGDEWGDPGGRLVLLQHGGGQTRHAWKNTGERLALSGYRVVAFDARGHGDSHWDASGRYDLELMARDLRAVVQALAAERPVLVGASMGGLTSLTALGERLVDAAALVLVDVAPKIDAEGRENIMAFMRQAPDGFESLEEVAEAIAAYQPHRPRPRKLDGLAKNVRLAADGRFRWHWDPRFVDGRGLDADRERRLRSHAATLTLPTLLVRGALSDILGDEHVEDFRTLCPHTEYVNVPDAAHMVAGDRNDVFGDAVLEFLLRVAPPTHGD